MNEYLGPFKNGDDALDALRRSVAEIIGADPNTWPEHTNAPLAIAAAVEVRDLRVKRLTAEAERLRTELDVLKAQKPVAWMKDQWSPDCGNYWEICREDEMGWRDCKGWTPLYTHPVPPTPSVPDEPSEDWFDYLIADVSAIPCRYHGDPSYDHDAYWMREEVIRMLEKRKAAAPKPGDVK